MEQSFMKSIVSSKEKILISCFPKGNKIHLEKFIRKWFGPYEI